MDCMTGDEARALREAKKLSQAELAERFGVNQATISRLERLPALLPRWRLAYAMLSGASPSHTVSPPAERGCGGPLSAKA